MLNSFKEDFYATTQTNTSAPSQELLSKLEQPGSQYDQLRTYTLTPTGVFLRKGEEIGMF
jgi:hypothetical protein